MVNQQLLMVGIATAASTLGAFSTPPQRLHKLLMNPIVEFLKLWLFIWVITQDVESSFVASAVWSMIMTAMLQPHKTDTATPHRRDAESSNRQGVVL